MRKTYIPDDYDDVSQNYGGSMLRGIWDGTPCVARIGHEAEVVFKNAIGNVLGRQSFREALEEHSLDFTIPPAHFVNVNFSAFWVSRKVTRQWKRGVRDQNTKISTPEGLIALAEYEPEKILRQFLIGEEYADVTEVYRSLVEDHVYSASFCSEMALGRMPVLRWPVLYFQSKPIGVTPQANVARIAEAYGYLRPKILDHFDEVTIYDGE